MRLTTLIPAFKPAYLRDLLRALHCQSVRPSRVIFSDDSPSGEFVRVLSAPGARQVVDDLHIEVVQGPRRGGARNMLHLLECWGGATELVHFLFDDDLIYPQFYERHLAAHADHSLSCSVSHRWTAHEDGTPIAQLNVPAAIGRHTGRLSLLGAEEMFASTIPQCNNWLGEFSNTVYRADQLRLIGAPRVGDVSFHGLQDVGMMIVGTLDRPLGLIQDHLGAFRLNPQQNTANLSCRPLKLAQFAWLGLAIGSGRIGQLNSDQVSSCVTAMGSSLLQRYRGQSDLAELLSALPALIERRSGAEEHFLFAWERYAAEF